MLSVSTSCNLFNFHKLSYQNADQNTRGKTTGKFPKQLRHLATFTCVDDRPGQGQQINSTGACVLHIGVLAHCIDMRIIGRIYGRGSFEVDFVCKNQPCLKGRCGR